MFSGVCKVNASVATSLMIHHFKPLAIINSGCAGAIAYDLEISNGVIGKQTTYHDVAQDILTEYFPWMDSIYFQADPRLLSCIPTSSFNGISTVIGTIVTGESFIVDNQRKWIEDSFNPLAVDMESANIAHTAYLYKVRFISIRGISDSPNGKGINVFEDHVHVASKNAAIVAIELLKEYTEF